MDPRLRTYALGRDIGPEHVVLLSGRFSLPNIVAICYKWYADFIGTFKVFCINAKKSENYKNNKMVQKVLKLVSTYLFWYFNK